ncbi:MAG TPA: ribose-phosphate pyrophosphokinase [Patescibacteria group bacterium]|nr:ribose-phosphate pyrophosphokinase [Patescibacteria group bacterium]
MKDFILYAGSSNLPLAHEVAKSLHITLGHVDLTRFADGELRPWIQDDIRDKTVIVLESFSFPMDEHIMEMVLMGDAIRRCAPRAVIAVIPYMGYSRQDKLHRLGEPVSARVIAKFLEVSMFDEIICVDLHNDAIVGFFQIPVMHISALQVLADEIKKMNIQNGVVISPDVGGVKRARNLAYALDLPMVVMEKRRFLDKHDTSETYQIIGDVNDKTAIIIDDIISTGGTTVQAAESLRQAGATSVIALATHGVLAGEAVEKLSHAPIDKIIVTNSIDIIGDKKFDKLHTVSIAPLIANAISTLVR